MVRQLITPILLSLCLTFPLTLLAADTPDTSVQFTGDTDQSWTGDITVATVGAVLGDDPVIKITINSPGGYVTDAVDIVEIMETGKAMGLTYKCRVTGEAASAAFFILAACSEREAVRSAKFMWHAAWGMFRIVDLSPMSPELAADLADAAQLQQDMNWYVTEMTRVPWSKWDKPFNDEHLFTAVELVEFAPGFISIIGK